MGESHSKLRNKRICVAPNMFLGSGPQAFRLLMIVVAQERMEQTVAVAFSSITVTAYSAAVVAAIM